MAALAALCGALAAAATLAEGATGTQPNLVFILVDDLGWNGVGFRNHTPRSTPQHHFFPATVVSD